MPAVFCYRFSHLCIRVLSSGQNTTVWAKDFEAHQRIVALVKDGQGTVAETYVQRMMERFALTAYDNWEKKPTAPARGQRQRGSGGKRNAK